MSYTAAHRDPATLVPAEFNDRRRIACTELVMLLEDSGEQGVSPVGFGQVILANALEGDLADVAALGDKVRQRLHI